MLVSACVVPSAPLLLPALVPDDPDVAPLRQSCVAAVRATLDAAPDRVVVVGGVTAAAPAGHFGAVGGSPDDQPLGQLVADTLLAAADWTGPVSFAIADGAPNTADTSDPDTTGSTAFVVLADLSAAVTDASPRPRNEASATMSDTIADALARADGSTLANLSTEKAQILSIEGVPALQHLAAEAQVADYDADVLFRGAPFGVDYTVTVWRRRTATC